MTKNIYSNVFLGKNVEIGNFVIIGKPPKDKKDGELQTIIGDNSIIRDHTIIYAGNKIGKNFKTGHHVLIRENNEIGDNVGIGSFSEIAFETKIGNNVRFHSGCKVYEKTIIEDDAKFNPGVYILNTKYPYRVGKEPLIEPVTIKKNAKVGANCILMPGITINEGALIGAGSLVNKDIPKYAVAYGRPAEVKKDVKELKDKEGNPLYGEE